MQSFSKSPPSAMPAVKRREGGAYESDIVKVELKWLMKKDEQRFRIAKIGFSDF